MSPLRPLIELNNESEVQRIGILGANLIMTFNAMIHGVINMTATCLKNSCLWNIFHPVAQIALQLNIAVFFIFNMGSPNQDVYDSSHLTFLSFKLVDEVAFAGDPHGQREQVYMSKVKGDAIRGPHGPELWRQQESLLTPVAGAPSSFLLLPAQERRP